MSDLAVNLYTYVPYYWLFYISFVYLVAVWISIVKPDFFHNWPPVGQNRFYGLSKGY